MRCTARPTLHWLLWLVIALLPLRGWALTPMASTEGPPVQSSAVLAEHVLNTPAPCHGADSLPGATPAQASAPHHAPMAKTGPACSLCNVCHAGLAPTPQHAVLNVPEWSQATPACPVATPAADGPPSRLFRPPRV